MSFFNFSIYKILNKDQSILDQARIRLLYYGMVLAFIAMGALFISVYLQHLPYMSASAAVMMVILAGLFKYLTYKPDWRIISHILLVTGTVVNLFTVFYLTQQVPITTIQIIILVIMFSFYMLGQNWGMFFSLLNVLPVLLFMVMAYDHSFFFDFKPERTDDATEIIGVFANFILIIFIHSHLYTAFIKNIRELKATGEEQAALNIKFEKAIQKAEKSSQAQAEFLSTMSHEIRTPLNAVIGMSNLLMMNNPRADQNENLEILKFSANNLLAIVNDVLDFNKIESGKIVFEKIRFNLVELMQNICGGQIIKAEEKGLLFKLDVDSSLRKKIIFGDPTRITQIIFNLVSNAIKFTSQGSVGVRVTCLEDRHNMITVGFSVKDTGIGIKKENLESIFEPFTQESISTTRQYGGTGLGLAIVKRLMELQGVQLNVKSTVGEGSEFLFNMEFPVATEVPSERRFVPKPQATAATPSAFSVPANSNGRVTSTPDAPTPPPVQAPEVAEVLNNELRVLIAEDNPVNVMLMKKLFSKWKIVPTIADNGERAVEIVQYGNFDIILMDLQMPVMNGFDASKEIRKMADPAKANIPIIALTASALFDIKDQVAAAGMNGYVAKPFKPDELMEKIQSLVATV
ncbi:response regulator [Mucilaginibacter pallidiroseus]|uniref:histidine kinase n=1 Tax=Mucilaginibacter pallidiroseus TaxID=2599295 RepID=A0A563UDE0_9SPHI|nr:ATP-binding protein [Mucilaginibacter pallidiroseus]TWR29375.1 response regulator [Mucilaginibacter pallidiroseus]